MKASKRRTFLLERSRPALVPGVAVVVKDICYVLNLQGEPSQKGRRSLSVGEMQRYLLSSPVSEIISFQANIRGVSGVVPGL